MVKPQNKVDDTGDSLPSTEMESFNDVTSSSKHKQSLVDLAYSTRYLILGMMTLCLVVLVTLIIIVAVDSDSSAKNGSQNKVEAAEDDSPTVTPTDSSSEDSSSFPGHCQDQARKWIGKANEGDHPLEDSRKELRYALAVFYCELFGEDWEHNEHWMTDVHECYWYFGGNKYNNWDGALDVLDSVPSYWSELEEGITPNGACEIISGRPYLQRMNLTNNGLHGSLPVLEMRLLTGLLDLDLSENSIVGTIPTLPALERLSLASNDMSGPILPGLNASFNAESIDCSNNRFSGQLDPSLLQVEYLKLQNNHFQGHLPTPFDWMVESTLDLKELRLNNNQFEGQIPSEYGASFPHLKILHLHANELTGTIPSELKELYVLNSLSLSGNEELTGEVDGDICELMYQYQLSTLVVDCQNGIMCDCCWCGRGCDDIP